MQDFKDVVGDAHVGRRTFPLVSERWARMSVIATLIPWSVALARVWELDILTMSLFVGLGVTIGLRFLWYRSIPDDKTSYQIYNVRRAVMFNEEIVFHADDLYGGLQIWLSCAHVLVGYWRVTAWK